MPGVPQTLPVPPLVNEMTMLNAIRLAAASGGGGGGGTGDVVGPASSTEGAVTLWDGLTGKLLKDSSVFITGGGTVALGGFTLTVPATGTAALLGISNIFTANGAASTPVISGTGTIFSGGTATTTKPYWLIEPTGTTSTAWNTSGTLFGANAASGFAGDLISLQRNGLAQFSVQANGPTRIIAPSGDSRILILNSRDSYLNDAAYFAIGGSGNLYWNGPLEAGGYFKQAVSAGALEAVYNFCDDAYISAQRFGTNAQTKRIYGTYTDGSNYERLSFITAAGAYSIKPEAAGTGTLRDLHISGLPTSNPGPGILWANGTNVEVGT